MFSRRLNLSSGQNAVTVALQQRRSAGLPILDLTESNPTLASLRYPKVKAAASLDSTYEPEALGLRSAREAVCAYMLQAQGVTVPPEHVCLTSSTSEAYSFLFKLLCDPGDEVLIPAPSYPLFEFLAGLESVGVAPYALRYHEGWWIDIEALKARVTERTRAIVVVNPNNPTGSYLKLGEFNQLRQLGLPIISDEVFSDYWFEPDDSRASTVAGSEGVLSFALSGLSKVCGLPQMKLSWIIASGREHAAALHRLEFIADTFLSVGTPVQLALPALLDSRRAVQEQIRARCHRNFRHLSERMTVLQAEGGWYATAPVPRVRTEEEWVLGLLNEHGVLVQPGYFYDFPSDGFLVLSLLTPEPVFREGCDRLLSYTNVSR